MTADISSADTAGRPPTVLQVLPALVTGGVERGTVEITYALVRAGWRAIVASSGGPMVHEVERAGGIHVTLPLASKNPFTMRRNIKRLREVIEAHEVDIVHARSRAPAWSAWMAARESHRLFVTTFHNIYGGQTVWKRFYNSVMAKGARVIAISRFVAEHAHRVYGVGRDRLRIIHRGVDLARFDPEIIHPSRLIALAKEWRLNDDARVIMLPARVTRWKGHMELLDAVAGLERRDVQVIFVGNEQQRPEYRREIETRVTALGLGGLVHMVGNCRDMPAAYMLADVVVQPSTEPEGFGRTAVEAQAMGRPMIATDHGGARETVFPGETGWLVPPGDVASLTSALSQALALDGEARLDLARHSRSIMVERFDSKLMCDATLAVYSELLFPEQANTLPPDESDPAGATG